MEWEMIRIKKLIHQSTFPNIKLKFSFRENPPDQKVFSYQLSREILKIPGNSNDFAQGNVFPPIKMFSPIKFFFASY